ncbi:MAG: hypothetical protein A2W33_02990 [Chloroflexi bacterium RBG_16_52_11]|nr:MAG: hypothetical protein A2W33_02990 [Chloroflexi bacterium RBG_16_52_11]
MNTSAIKNRRIVPNMPRLQLHRGLLFGIIIITALLAFEFFNYSTTVFALTDLLGNLEFLSLRWATILAIAFCGIDFAGIARLFTPEEGANEPAEVWYLFAAWLLAATMNAMLTWWGVSIAILNHQSLGNAVVSNEMLLKIVPIFVAVMVWLIRVLIIGTFSVAGDRLFSQSNRRPYSTTNTSQSVRTFNPANPAKSASSNTMSFKPSPKPSPSGELNYTQAEPTYHPLSMNANSSQNPANRTKR